MAASKISHRSELDEAVLPAPCLICGQLLGVKTEELEDDVNVSSLETDSNGSLFQYFFKLFGVNPENWGKLWTKLGHHGGEADSEQVPFCNLCKHRLQLLLDLHHKLEQLKEQHRIGKEEMKKLLEVSEESLQKQDIYKRDKRYLGIRRKILGRKRVVSPDAVNCDPLDVLVPPAQRSRRTSSSRKAALKANEKLSMSISEARNYPIVMLSTADRTNADAFIKQEASCSSEKVECEYLSATPLSDIDLMEADISNFWFSNASSDPDYLEISEPRKKKTSTKKNDGIKNARAHQRKTYINEFLTAKTSDSVQTEPESGGSSSNDQRSLRKARLSNDEGDDDDDLVPLAEESDSMSNEESSNDETEGMKAWKLNRLRIDKVTGNLTLLQVTLEKLPNNESGNEQYKCLTCSTIVVQSTKTSVRKASVRAHVYGMHSDKYKCNQCSKRFSTRGRLNEHKRTHEKVKEKIFPCKICGRPFSFHTSEAVHRKTHLSLEEKEEIRKKKEGSGPSKTECRNTCDECGQKFQSKSELEYHIKSRHGTEEDKTSLKRLCQLCGRHVNRLERHMRTVHATEKNYQCPLCDERFRILKQLKRHKSSVHNIGPLKCTMCPKTFSEKMRFDDHLKAHLNIRPFQCEHCPSAFFKPHQLKRHFKVYHEEGSKGSRRGTYVRGPNKNAVVPKPAN